MSRARRAARAAAGPLALGVACVLAAAAPGCAHARAGDPSAPPPSPPAAAAPAAVAAPEVHPHLLADLAPAGPFPRFTPAQLAASGYPDHMHAFFWPGWEPSPGADGLPCGPGSLCRDGQLLPRDGLVTQPGRIDLPWLGFTCSPGYAPCDLMLFVELCDWGRDRARRLLGLAPAGRLQVASPDDLPAYQARTGYGSWRLYRLAGDSCVVEPVPTLVARTLVAHVAVELTTRWTLERATGDRLPLWLRAGLAAYVADMGVHLANFMAPYRPAGPVLLPPAEVEAILAAPPDTSGSLDQKRFRCASYSAFVMAWRLVEDHGGLVRLREALARVAGGEDWARACRQVYGETPDRLAARLDAAAGAEPIGSAVQPRRPHLPPGTGGP